MDFVPGGFLRQYGLLAGSGLVPSQFSPNSAWAPLLAVVQRQQARSRLVKYAMSSAAVWDIIDDQPAPRRGRGGTVGAGSRPGGRERDFVDFKTTKWGKMLANPSVHDPKHKPFFFRLSCQISGFLP